MASYIDKNTMKFYDKLGNEHKIYPKTTVDQVVGLESKIAELQEDSTVVDTYGITGTVSANVKPQNMFNVIGNFIKNLAITTSNFASNFTARLKNNLTTTEEGYGLDARQGRVLASNITTLSDSVDNRLQVINTSIEALEQSTEHMIAAKIVLDKDDWVNNAQTITVAGMQSEDDMCIFICPFASSTETFVSNNIICNVQSIDTLGFKCDTVPNVDVEIYLVLKSATTEEDLANLEIALTEAYQVIQQINTLNATATTNISSLNTQNSTATTNISSLSTANQTASARIDSLTTGIGNAETTLSSITAQNNLATSNISDLGLANNTATSNISDLGTENTNATSNISDLQSAITLASSSVSSLNTANTTAATNINTLDGINSTAAQNISDINTATSDGQTVLGSLSAMNTTASETLADLQEANDSALENIDQLNLENKLDIDGDSENVTTTFTSADVAESNANTYTDPGVMSSGETHTSLFGKISQIAKNVKYLYNMLGTTDISSIGNGTATGAITALNNSLANKANGNPDWQSGVDLNTMLTSGLYWLSTSLTNCPTTWCGLLVIGRNDTARQIVFTNDGYTWFYRRFQSNSWSSWARVSSIRYHSLVQVTTGGNTTYTGKIIFNSVIQNYGDCYSTSTGEFTCPVNGIYSVSFGYYSNNTATNARPAIMCNGTQIVMTNGAYGQTLNITRAFTAGDKITAGAYWANYPISLYAGSGHNYFSVTLIQAL